jgi:hypothetical protein
MTWRHPERNFRPDAYYEQIFLLQSNHCNRCARSASTGMPQPPEMRGDMRDANYCLQKAKEYRAKAKETTDADLRVAFEAVAREFELRAREITARDSKPQGA